ncbi:rhodanese-like domain-containing protein [Flavobacterium pectinovorum]|uniref:Rhodanese-like domain-containing protein n=1 Tax=Flavobacterium pectinovorum TaxID=29533 RepID=A0A502EVF5_9FLAO|nr:rhodanese-like domain-containing protein [Flavobacterium pectinovorum]TPG41537.1 rhodanese-like domain-containing protein [Flavobacterium pectinovorum]
MKNITILNLVFFCLTSYIVHSQTNPNILSTTEQQHYPKALVDYVDFKNLVLEIEKERENRLVSLEVFLKMSHEKNTIILDSRSDVRYNRKHLKGAIHLDFTDFTQENLYKLIPDPNTKILIYCNNNFNGDQIDFASKVLLPKKTSENQTIKNGKPVMLALNIPTYINLYGYGYKNIYELDELVNVNDPRIKFEGTEVK